MPECEVCGNDYDKVMEIRLGGSTHVFDSFECAVHALAPPCKHFGIKIVGHGVEANGDTFCCAHCAEREGVSGARDRV